MNELKPCPFCGETPQIEAKPLWELSRDGALHGYVGHYKYDIRCQKCGCNVTVRNNTTIYSGHKKARENAIKAWNRRADIRCVKIKPADGYEPAVLDDADDPRLKELGVKYVDPDEMEE